MRVLLLILVTLLHSQVRASDGDAAEPFKAKCSNGTMLEMNDCLTAEWKMLDGQLNKSYRVLLAELVDGRSLRSAQRAWLDFRDKECDYALSGLEKGGSLYPYALHSCRIDLTVKRLKDIDGHLAEKCNGCPPRK
jgi:uncharacterized protein YecT (DUF1311 family)